MLPKTFTIQCDTIDIVLPRGSRCRVEIFAQHDSVEDVSHGAFRFRRPLQLIDQRRSARNVRELVALHFEYVQRQKVDFTAQTRTVEFLHQTRGGHVRVDDVVVESSRIEENSERRERRWSTDRFPAITSTAV